MYLNCLDALIDRSKELLELEWPISVSKLQKEKSNTQTDLSFEKQKTSIFLMAAESGCILLTGGAGGRERSSTDDRNAAILARISSI